MKRRIIWTIIDKFIRWNLTLCFLCEGIIRAFTLQIEVVITLRYFQLLKVNQSLRSQNSILKINKIEDF